jgi:hypothetical protein
MTTTEHDYTAQARQAIEIVCAGNLSRIEEFYRPDFVDHINDMTFHGYDGGRESVAFYKTIFKNLRMAAEEQITEGNRVASRWVLNGTYHGRMVTLRGITVSRFGTPTRSVSYANSASFERSSWAWKSSHAGSSCPKARLGRAGCRRPSHPHRSLPSQMVIGERIAGHPEGITHSSSDRASSRHISRALGRSCVLLGVAEPGENIRCVALRWKHQMEDPGAGYT